ncbi:TraB/GumN family protein [Hyphococcus luteus]|uniref:TraB/GumN family protein n=1 Tax=Hyphococcus luteus TaxID=2058213 RepID=A0A2S7K865_9PROT|nr:TraB/GumN family protein [Marinicaulis flavus]PQA88686.1 TraB/GumN family protein [Marinicaulis flavus]
MKFFIAAATALTMGLGPLAGAAGETPETKENILEVETAAPAMWRVRDADSDYILFGTFHILPPGLDWRREALNEAFAEADVVYFEVEADTRDAEAKTLNTIMTQGFNKAGVTLSGMLEKKDAQKLREIASEVNLPFAAIDTMRPWNAFLSLSVQFIIDQGFDPSHGADSVLTKEAKAAGKEVRFFETIEEQLALFTTLDPETEKNLLILTIRDWDKQAAAFDDLFRAWAQADVDLIDTDMNEDMREKAPAVYERLIAERNRNWAEQLDAVLKAESGKGFVAVGAGHLVGGKDSVPALLKEMGYEVTRYGAEAANDN